MNILNPQEIVLGGGMIRGFLREDKKPLGKFPKEYLRKRIRQYAVPSVTSAHIEDMLMETDEKKRDLASVGAALIFKDESYFEYIKKA